MININNLIANIMPSKQRVTGSNPVGITEGHK